MKINKDRYTQAATLCIVGMVGALCAFEENKTYVVVSLVTIILSVLYTHYLTTRSTGKIHLTDTQQKDDGILFKEKGNFGTSIKKVNDVKVDGVVYRVVNGADVYIKNRKVVPCGPGSFIMQIVGGGGKIYFDY